MKKITVGLVIMMSYYSANSQANSDTVSSAMIKILNKGFEYYNSQNWADMKKLHADTVKVYEFPNTLRDSNVEEMISHYPKTFAKYPNNRGELLDITIVGNRAICKVRISGRGEPFVAVNIYQFENNKIVKIWFISNSPTTPRPSH